MQSYGQFCPVARAAEVFGERWTPLLVRELLCGSTRFNDLRRGVPRMSPALLSKRLKDLEKAGVVVTVPRDSGTVEYRLSPAGEDLRPLILGMGFWGQRWVESHLSLKNLDPSLLMWDMRRSINVERLPEKRVVVRFDFRAAPKGKRSWWLVLERPEPDLCLSDPGFGVALTVRTDVVAMASVWVGDLDLAGAIRSRLILLEGPSHLRRAFPSWLSLSPLTEIKSAR
jgi:DNA-binding HxlR family transcriptional regulator